MQKWKIVIARKGEALTWQSSKNGEAVYKVFIYERTTVRFDWIATPANAGSQ